MNRALGPVSVLTETLPKGSRIRLVHTDDPYTGLRPGDVGTVVGVSAVSETIDVNWDSGSKLSLLIQHDTWEQVR